MLDLYNKLVEPFFRALGEGMPKVVDFFQMKLWDVITSIPLLENVNRPDWVPDVTMLAFALGSSVTLFLVVTLVKWVLDVVT